MTKRAAIYARYSSDLQKDTSIDDQVALCRQAAERSDLQVVKVYADRALSGTTVVERDQLLDMLQAAKQGQFDVVLTEAIDRLSRDQEDLHGIRKRLSFARVELMTVHEGVVDGMSMALRGLLAEEFVKQLSQKVRRGLSGLARNGKTNGTVPYGYRHVLGKPGEREIDPDTAPIVQRIFQEYADGRSPREICADLNREGIPGPRGRWNHQTLTAGRDGDGGLIRNEFYIGRLIWGKNRHVLNPETQKKVKRRGDPKEMVVTEVPHLRIIDDELWERVQKVRLSRSTRTPGPNGYVVKRKPKGLLTNLFRCSECGSHMIVTNYSNAGGFRIECATAHTHPDQCSHSKSYDADVLERAVLKSLQEELSREDRLQACVDAYRSERSDLEKKARSEEASVTRKLAQVDGSILRYCTALERNSMPEEVIYKRLQELESERVSLKDQLRLAKEQTSVIAIHPGAVKRYLNDIASLQERITDPKDPVARNALHALIEAVIVFPTAKRAPYRYEIVGKLSALLGANLFPAMRSPEEMAEEEGVSYPKSVKSTNVDWTKLRYRKGLISLGFGHSAQLPRRRSSHASIS